MCSGKTLAALQALGRAGRARSPRAPHKMTPGPTPRTSHYVRATAGPCRMREEMASMAFPFGNRRLPAPWAQQSRTGTSRYRIHIKCHVLRREFMSHRPGSCKFGQVGGRGLGLRWTSYKWFCCSDEARSFCVGPLFDFRCSYYLLPLCISISSSLLPRDKHVALLATCLSRDPTPSFLA